MKNNPVSPFIYLGTAAVVLLIGAVLLLCVFINRENRFRDVIAELRENLKERDEQISSMRSELAALKGETDTAPDETDSDTYRYLAIGNSLTWHRKCDYWWNECGMAASRAENDFVHVVVRGLEEKYGKVSYTAYNFSVWEITAHDRIQTVQAIDSMLTEDLDLITLQLGENVTDLSTFAVDYDELIRYIQDKCPNTMLIIVDEYKNQTKSTIKEVIAERHNLPFADLTEMQNNPEYLSSMGATVYDEEGNPHIIDHTGVAGHPGDKGMKFIGDAILALLP